VHKNCPRETGTRVKPKKKTHPKKKRLRKRTHEKVEERKNTPSMNPGVVIQTKPPENQVKRDRENSTMRKRGKTSGENETGVHE